jgi:hypothetical protein
LDYCPYSLTPWRKFIREDILDTTCGIEFFEFFVFFVALACAVLPWVRLLLHPLLPSWVSSLASVSSFFVERPGVGSSTISTEPVPLRCGVLVASVCSSEDSSSRTSILLLGSIGCKRISFARMQTSVLRLFRPDSTDLQVSLILVVAYPGFAYSVLDIRCCKGLTDAL